MQRWKFGRGQTAAEERREIRAAHRAGLSEQYAEGQRMGRLVEAEHARRVERKRARRAARPVDSRGAGR
jgi:hypothetical protein